MRNVALKISLPVVTIALLAGCASGTPTATSAPPSATPTASSTPAPEPTSSSGAGQIDPNAPDGQCADENLAVSVKPDEGGAAAGSIPYVITFTNSGPECVLEGAPGVSIRGDDDSIQIGEPAEQQGTAEPVTLAEGGTAIAPLSAVNIGTTGGPLGDACKATTGEGYRIYPPHSFEPVFVTSAGVAACSSSAVFLQVGVVTAG